MSRVQLSVEDFVTDAKTRGMGLHLSTYDVPRSGVAEFDRNTGTLAIKFRYIDEEPSIEQRLNDDIAVRFGKPSGKLLEIIIQIAKRNIAEVRLGVSAALEQIERALEDRISHTRRYNQLQNYAGMRSVLGKNRTTVVSSTSTAAAY